MLLQIFALEVLLLVALLGNQQKYATAEPNPAYVCSFCAIALGLVEQAAFQIRLSDYLTAKCGDSDPCKFAVQKLIHLVEKQLPPDDICLQTGLCSNPECRVYSVWPPKELPPQPKDWPVERRQLSDVEAMERADLTLLKPLFLGLASALPQNRDPANTMMAHVSMALGKLLSELKAGSASAMISGDDLKYEACGFNLTCKVQNLVAHLPLQDNDGDRYSMEKAKRLRGTDWRGIDCDDKRNDVYPGRKASNYGSDIDHNCNGIYGGNSTAASYEELYCANSQPRGLIMLGDSATAHFHIPPQWVTAQGWNLNGLLPTAENEIDFRKILTVSLYRSRIV